MTTPVKPPVVPIWGESNTTSADMVQPTDPQIQAGWPLTTTPPSRQRFNWLQNFLFNAARYFSRRGIVDYDAAETYMTGDIVRGDTGLIQRSLVDNNTAHTPSTSPTQWGSPLAPTPAVDDNTTKIATTAYVLAQVSVTLPAMNGTANVGSGNRFALSNHVHPSDTSKANTSGTYAGLSVGFATTSGGAPWSGITGHPTTCSGYGITDAITTATISSQSVAFATNANRAHPVRADGVSFDINWSGQSGQPTWLLGSGDGVNWYVWNPSNFSVNFATTASQAATQSVGTANSTIATTAFVNRGSSHGSNGYELMPSGLIFQWGLVFVGDIPGTPTPAVVSVSWPISFPNAILVPPQLSVYDTTGGPGGEFTPICVAYNTGGATFYINELQGAVQNVVLSWFAIGT